MATHFQPPHYHSITPYMMVRDAERAIAWYSAVFGATELMRMPGPDGKIVHAEIKIQDSVVMLAEENEQFPGPQMRGGAGVSLMLYVPDVDAVFHKAMANGASQIRGLQDQFYGDRSATFRDPFGHSWSVGTHIEDVSPEEMEKRMAAYGQPSS